MVEQISEQWWSIRQDPPYIVLSGNPIVGFPRCEVLILSGGAGLETNDDNVDIEVTFETGERWFATFFTLQNLQSLFIKNKKTGECHQGLYFWASSMIIVERLTIEVIAQTISGLLQAKEFESAFDGPYTRTE